MGATVSVCPERDTRVVCRLDELQSEVVWSHGGWGGGAGVGERRFFVETDCRHGRTGLGSLWGRWRIHDSRYCVWCCQELAIGCHDRGGEERCASRRRRDYVRSRQGLAVREESGDRAKEEDDQHRGGGRRSGVGDAGAREYTR